VSLTRNQLLLAVAAALATIRFLIVPWIDWQSEQHDALAVLTQRLDRAVGVVENRAAIDKAVVEVEKSVNALRTRFPAEVDVEPFRLTSQQQISSISQEFGLNVRLFEWMLDGEAAGGRLQYSRARVQLEGGARALAKGQAALETRLSHLVVREVNLAFGSPSGGPDDQGGNLSLVVDLYRRPVPAAVATPSSSQ
jgi:hypothetical protein